MKSDATWTAIVGSIIVLLQAFGFITASEGTSLTTQAAAVLTGVIALVSTIRAIVKRHKAGDATGGEEE